MSNGPVGEGRSRTSGFDVDAVASFLEGRFLKISIARRFGTESSTSADLGNFLNKSIARMEARDRNSGSCRSCGGSSTGDFGGCGGNDAGVGVGRDARWVGDGEVFVRLSMKPIDGFFDGTKIDGEMVRTF